MIYMIVLPEIGGYKKTCLSSKNKDAIKYMCNYLGIEPMDVLRDATKKNINQILEKIYKKFVYYQAYDR